MYITDTQLAASNGASLMGFIQDGSGAVARTAQDKFRESISLSDFGAVGDGVTDDTHAIQAAVAQAAASGRAVFVDGQFRYTEQIIVPDSVHLWGSESNSYEGSRSGSCLIKDFDAEEGAGVLFQGNDSGASFIQFDNAHDTDTGDNVQLEGSRTYLDNCSATNAGRNGVRVGSDVDANTNVFRVFALYAGGNGQDGLHITDNSGSGPGDVNANAGLIAQVDSLRNGRYGVYNGRAWFNTFLHLHCEENVEAGLVLGGSSRSCTVVGGDLEANGGSTPADFVIESGAFANIALISLEPGVHIQNDASRGANKIVYFAAGSTNTVVDGDEVNVVNPRSSDETRVNLFTGPNQDPVASLRGSLLGTSGGQLDIWTKRDGNTPKKG